MSGEGHNSSFCPRKAAANLHRGGSFVRGAVKKYSLKHPHAAERYSLNRPLKWKMEQNR